MTSVVDLSISLGVLALFVPLLSLLTEQLQVGLLGRPDLIEQHGEDFHTNNMLLSAREAVWVFGWVAVVPLVCNALIMLIQRRVVCPQLGGAVRWNWAQLQPRLSRLNTLHGLRRMFGPIAVGANGAGSSSNGAEGVLPTRLLVELIRSTAVQALGVAILVGLLKCDLAWWLIRDLDSVGELCALLQRELCRLAGGLLSVWCLVGAVDLLVEGALYAQRLRMDVNELKLELRQSEGSPELRGLRRQLHQTLLLHELVQGVRRAKMLVVNGGARR